MKPSRFFQSLTLVGTALALIGAILVFRHREAPKLGLFIKSDLLVQNTYLGPITPVPGNPQLIRVEVSVYDDPKPGGVEIQFVELNGTKIPLKPRDVYGFRGKGSFQLPPGGYKLKWTVNRDKFAWPRSVSHEESINLDKRDLWLQVMIQGETASIQ